MTIVNILYQNFEEVLTLLFAVVLMLLVPNIMTLKKLFIKNFLSQNKHFGALNLPLRLQYSFLGLQLRLGSNLPKY